MNSLLACVVVVFLTVVVIAICVFYRRYPCDTSQDLIIAVFGNSRAQLAHPLVCNSTTHFDQAQPTLVVSSSASARSGGGESLPPLVTFPNPEASVSTPSASNDEDDYKRPERLVE